MQTLLKTSLSRLTVALAAAAITASTASAQITFGTSGYSCASWGSCGSVGEVGGVNWWGATVLDVDAYKNALGVTPAPETGYPSGVVALGTETITAQPAGPGFQFWLNSLTVGSGWLNGITLTVKGYEDFGGPTVINESKMLFASAPQGTTAAAPTTWTFSAAGPIRYFTIEVDWAHGDMPAWDGALSSPSWTRACPVGVCTGSYAVDPWDSRSLKRDADAFNGLTYDGNPYGTYFLQSAMLTRYTVPEPATFGLVAVGLAGLVGVARRRRSAR